MSVMRRAWDCPPCGGSGAFVDAEDPTITAECVYCGATGKLVSAAAYQGAVAVLRAIERVLDSEVDNPGAFRLIRGLIDDGLRDAAGRQ